VASTTSTHPKPDATEGDLVTKTRERSFSAGRPSCWMEITEVDPPADEGADAIDLEEFSREAAQDPAIVDLHIGPEQIREAIGGVANLYLEKAIKLKVKELNVQTSHAFASQYVGLGDVVQEIGNCTGVSAAASERILTAMENTLRNAFLKSGRFKSNPGRLLFRPLGKIQLKDLESSSYHLTFRDPAADHEHLFLHCEGRVLDEFPLATLVHISDLHFAEKFTSDAGLTKKILRRVPRLQGVYPHSYQAARALAGVYKISAVG